MGIVVHSLPSSFQIVVGYCPVQCKRNDGSAAAYKRDLEHHQRLIVGGDLNAKHGALVNIRQNINGELLFNFAQEGRFIVEYPDSPMFISASSSNSTLDLFLSNIEINKPETLDDLTSDHFPKTE